ncbi:MAG TPA: hypothetical protein VNJ01_08080 [Bacteriovoracaceae bacterium]|nr:hypothetical protein [Bacteriovoracaceae bacterium]
MVGLKTFWILTIAIVALSACVPQTKQTKCGANEAFSATARDCVTVSENSKVYVDSFNPIYALTKYRSDTTAVELRVDVKDPYQLGYRIEWRRTFGAVVDFPTMGADPEVITFIPSTYGALFQIGTHLFTAVVTNLDGTLTYDTHTFQINISNDPLPVIDSLTVQPLSYNLLTPQASDALEFSFNIKNNGAETLGLAYKTIWYIIKNGAPLIAFQESDAFSDFSLNGTNTAYYGNFPVKRFDPSVVGLGVGNYVVRARITRGVFPLEETVAEQQWSVTVKHPDFGDVSIISSPAPGVSVTAHHLIKYPDFPTRSWIFNSPVEQPKFCVTLNNPTGAYPAPVDTAGVLVKFYKDGVAGDICTKRSNTALAVHTLCLVDAALNTEPCLSTPGTGFDENLLVFQNVAPEIQQLRSITARIYDEASGIEFDRANIEESSGSYPVEWKVLVKPANAPPVLSFGSINPVCLPDGTFGKKDCAVTQGTSFTVTFKVTDEYNALIPAEAANFTWSVKLKFNGTDIVGPATTCTNVTNPGYVGNQFTCPLTLPHAITTGPLNPNIGNYTVVATLADNGSPVSPAAPATATDLTWKLKITQTNVSGIDLGPQMFSITESHIKQGVTTINPASAAAPIEELKTISFNLKITDLEFDDFKYKISRCTVNVPTPCFNSTPITTPIFVDLIRALQVPVVDPTLPVVYPTLLYTLPENVLLQQTPIQDVDTTVGAARLVYFRVDVEDVPSVPYAPPAADQDFEIFQLYVRNFNPPPQLSTGTANPPVSNVVPLKVFSGQMITIDPGSVTDPSSPGSGEEIITYQWFAQTGAGAYTAITGATERILRWTPGNVATNIKLKLCVGDRPLANPATIAAGNCSGDWLIAPKPYLNNLTATGLGNVDKVVATWFDATNTVPNTHVIYSAYYGDNQKIYVEKTIKTALGAITHQTISFDALPIAAMPAGVVSDLSLSGSANTLFVSYIASSSASPLQMSPQIRRIDKSYTVTENKSGLAHPAPFGFNYDHYTLAGGTCTTAPAPTPVCGYTLGNGVGSAARITFTTKLASGNTVIVNGHVFTADASPTLPDEICDSGACVDINSTAANLAAKINASTASDLQGIRAVPSGPNVDLFGQFHLDYLNFPALNVATNGIGKIMVVGSNWYLPIINSSLAGSSYNNITILSGVADAHLNSAPPNTNDVLTEMKRTALFDAAMNAAGDELVIARISGELSDAGSLSIFRYGLSAGNFEPATLGPNEQNKLQIFGTFAFESVKLATNKASNDYLYVLAKERTVDGGAFHIGRYSHKLRDDASPAEDLLLNELVSVVSPGIIDLTDDILDDDAKLIAPEIISIPSYPEARIFFKSVGTSGTDVFPRLARWKSDNSITCGTCDPLSPNVNQTGANIGISLVAANITLGDAGAVATENVRDVVFAIFSSQIGANFKPQLGYINVKAEPIQSTTIDPLTGIPVVTGGLWMSPFVKD